MVQRRKEFRSVALVTILLGAAIFAFGLVTWYLNCTGSFLFYFPASKVVGGWMLVSLGYIHLNLELMRAES